MISVNHKCVTFAQSVRDRESGPRNGWRNESLFLADLAFHAGMVVTCIIGIAMVFVFSPYIRNPFLGSVLNFNDFTAQNIQE